MTGRRPWPFPGDSALGRARRIAQSYRAGLLAADPGECARLDSRAMEFGEGWVVPKATNLDGEDWVTLAVAADLVGRSVDAVRKWVTGHHGDRKVLARQDDQGRWLVQVNSVVDASAEASRKRAARLSASHT